MECNLNVALLYAAPMLLLSRLLADGTESWFCHGKSSYRLKPCGSMGWRGRYGTVRTMVCFSVPLKTFILNSYEWAVRNIYNFTLFITREIKNRVVVYTYPHRIYTQEKKNIKNVRYNREFSVPGVPFWYSKLFFNELSGTESVFLENHFPYRSKIIGHGI